MGEKWRRTRDNLTIGGVHAIEGWSVRLDVQTTIIEYRGPRQRSSSKAIRQQVDRGFLAQQSMRQS
jgi:hypothetical protein